ncbi:helix-turn-helix domain-containing protein [Clostridiaceae bacterium UIB06]|uniref:Helix-turn-helix domain-containing protein n=1 Tax=Clostridium thailandense TaxID=2794346 RepID=A0A949U5A7_9CLOT|nr:helix-turn-helix domain-containing protein [Clostridium thailandense]MBV7276719.1 helix-turn-helix domain-containing protein [Clostridium thailandense]MCH5138046.1 helix-turn-helix domain-containing protein [Clostridiaceae bacterium UIB06]
MESFRDFLDDLCLNTGIRFNLFEDNNELYHGLDSESSETIRCKLKAQNKELYIYLDKKNKDNIKLISYIIVDKYKEKYCIREKLMIDLLNGKEVGIDLIEKNLYFLQDGIIILLVNVDKNKNEALEIIKQSYLDQEVISFIYGDDIVICGAFDDIEEHARSIKEAIVSHVYCKVYVSLGNRSYDAVDIVNSYRFTKESMMLGKRFCSKDEIFYYDKMLFEKIVFNIDYSVKEELMSRFKDKFDVFDKEIINTIEEFANCGLNISDASRKLYVHRNTLIYRIEKIKKETGFDIRQFTDATVFIISFMIWKEKYRN